MRVISLFSGAGGLDLGLTRWGLEPELVAEIDPLFCRTLQANLTSGTKILNEDVSKLHASDLDVTAYGREVDLLVGGPPCQSFSTGGGRAGLSDPRGNLIFEFIRLINEVRPKVFVLENVANLITAALSHRPIAERPGQRWNLASYASSSQSIDPGVEPMRSEEMSGSAIKYLLEVIQEELNYDISLGVLNSAEHGAPQKRLRLVIIGARDGKAPMLPIATHGEDALPYRTVRDAIWDLRNNAGPGSEYSERLRGYFDLVPEGGNWRSLPTEVAAEAMGQKSLLAGGGKTGFFRRLAWDAPSPTITGKANRKGSAMCHPEFSRPITVRECARLQGFPDTWHFEGGVGSQYTQIGNAVPVELGAAVGKAVTEYLSGSGAVESRSLETMLADASSTLRQAARNKVARKVAA
ncbi:DNA (cytosine-5-)-methyltransferase [Pseudarthrobacter sp. AG30]|uniref:DNA cytosine methyltransferase n=1 Tax=Pseudarthrobacter sp. AG30 TaxID=2249742 RepID=UPI000D6DF854|nr:DNA cytosine methyltransferase [Pseudarthrobacter sp. AG30]RAX15982.1 DNA (cytosine-5-)-methyltransferase [Pseudarthrobacter sp. AG30]